MGSLCSSELVKEQVCVGGGKIGRENLSNLLFFVAEYMWLVFTNMGYTKLLAT